MPQRDVALGPRALPFRLAVAADDRMADRRIGDGGDPRDRVSLMRRLWRAVTAHRAAIGFTVLSLFVVLALAGVQQRTNDACRDRKHQWDALHAVIIESYRPQPPPKQILALFPQIAPIYTPGTKEYRAAQLQTQGRLMAVLAKLGDRPAC